MENRKCFVPTCKNDSVNNPNKIFVRIREDLREKWCREVNVDYFKVYTMYCCEDHFEPREDLVNYFKVKLMKDEPKLKRTAKLRNISVLNEHSSESQPKDCELQKLLLQPRTSTTVEKRKHEDIVVPGTFSTCTPVKVHAATQCAVQMFDKGTNCTIREITGGKTTFEILSQEVSPAATSSLFGYKEMEESTMDKANTVLQSRKVLLDKMFRKPRMYLGLPKQYLWLIDYLVQKNTQQIDSLCLIVTLFKIKQNDSVDRISDELELSRTKLATMIQTGIGVLGNFFQYLIFNPHPKEIKKNPPLAFKIGYSNVEMIIDCIEIRITKPLDPIKQAQTWSQYKNCNTVKYLIGCTPNGLITFLSQGYGGRITDKALFEHSNLLDILQPNTVVLAARHFKEIEVLLNSRGIKLLRPPGVHKGIKQSQAETLQSKVIASLKVHVERVIRRIRGFSLLKQYSVVNYKYVPYLNEIVVIACGLVNLQGNYKELGSVPIIL